MRTVHTALSRVPGVRNVAFEEPDRFVVTYDAEKDGVLGAMQQAVTSLGYEVKIL